MEYIAVEAIFNNEVLDKVDNINMRIDMPNGNNKHKETSFVGGANIIFISVVMCTYNGEKYIGEQIESILNQTLLPQEIIIGDDGSTDKTLSVIEDWRSKIEGLGIRLVIYHNNHLGPHGNFKTTLPKATCELIAPCDQDDVWLPEKLEKCSMAMVDGVDVVYCDEYILHEDGQMSENNIQPPKSVLDQLFGTHLAGHLLLFRNKLVNVYEVAPEITFDYGITIAASCQNRIAHINNKLCCWRRHNDVVTSRYSAHNPFNVIKLGKWKKWYMAIIAAIKVEKSLAIEQRYQSLGKIVKVYLSDDKDKMRIIKLCECIQRQSVWSIVFAGWLYMCLRTHTNIFRNYSLKDKLANVLFNFTYPAGWWYEYRIFPSI